MATERHSETAVDGSAAGHSTGMLHKIAEQQLLPWKLRQVFRVPLHTDREGQRRIFDGLHHRRAIAGDDAHTLPEFRDGLVVPRVHMAAAALQDALHMTAR